MIVAYPPVSIDTDHVTEPFWTMLREGQLSIQRCSDCGTSRTPPNLYCPNCRSTRSEWPPLSGRGELYSFAIVPLNPKNQKNEVYVAALVRPEELPDTKLYAGVIDCSVADLRIGMALELVPPEPDVDRVLFRPAAQGGR
jgi:hypothetical protein